MASLAPNAAANAQEDVIDGLADPENFGVFPIAQFPLSAPEASAGEHRIDLSSDFPDVRDQGRYPTCAAWAVASLLSYHLKRSEVLSSGEAVSARFLYCQLAGGRDNAIRAESLQEALRMSEGGFVLDSEFPTPGAESPPVCDGYPRARHAISSFDFAVEYMRENAHGYQTELVELMKAYLRSGLPIVLGMRVDNTFGGREMRNRLALPAYAPPGQGGGLHGVVVVGFDDDLSGFIIRNSYGPAWGHGGQALLPYSAVLQASRVPYAYTIRPRGREVSATERIDLRVRVRHADGHVTMRRLLAYTATSGAGESLFIEPDGTFGLTAQRRVVSMVLRFETTAGDPIAAQQQDHSAHTDGQRHMAASVSRAVLGTSLSLSQLQLYVPAPLVAVAIGRGATRAVLVFYVGDVEVARTPPFSIAMDGASVAVSR